VEVRCCVLTSAGQKRAPAPLCQAPSPPLPPFRGVWHPLRSQDANHNWTLLLGIDWARVVDLDERDTRSSLQLSSSDRTCLLCDGASDEAARKVDQQRSQSLGISKHTELAAFFYFEKS
jgi:hypothetical protein